MSHGGPDLHGLQTKATASLAHGAQRGWSVATPARTKVGALHAPGSSSRSHGEITVPLVEQVARLVTAQVPGVHHIRRPLRIRPMSGLGRDMYSLSDLARGGHAGQVVPPAVVVNVAAYVTAGMDLRPVTDALRAAVCETIESLTRLRVKVIHIHVLGEGHDSGTRPSAAPFP